MNALNAKNIRKLLVTTSAVSLLIIGAAAVGAQDDADTDAPTFEAQPGFRGNRGGRGFGFGEGERPERGEGEGRFGRPGRRGQNIEQLQEWTGLTAEELRDALQSGSTIAELIEANGGDVDVAIAEAVTEATDRINEAVEAGRISEEDAEARIAELETHITERFNGTFERPERPQFEVDGETLDS